MESITLYYYFSTIAQVLAAISALLAVFTHFKISEIKDFLIGDGMATFKRMEAKETGYDLPKDYKKYLDRLRDSIGRRSIIGIQEVIEELAKNEKSQGRTLKTNPRGLQYLETRFMGRLSQISIIKLSTKLSIILAFIAIIISIVSLVFVEYLNCCCHASLMWMIVILIIITTLFSMVFTIKGIFYGLKDHEDV